VKKVASDIYETIDEVTKGNVNKCIVYELNCCGRNERVVMIESIIVMHCFTLLKIQGCWFVPRPTLTTSWIDKTVSGGKHATQLLIGFLCRKL
jgi:hypothetical protein